MIINLKTKDLCEKSIFENLAMNLGQGPKLFHRKSASTSKARANSWFWSYIHNGRKHLKKYIFCITDAKIFVKKEKKLGR